MPLFALFLAFVLFSCLVYASRSSFLFLFSAQVAYLFGLYSIGFASCLPLIFARSFAQFFFPFRRALPFYPYSFGINIAQPSDVCVYVFCLALRPCIPLFWADAMLFCLVLLNPSFLFSAHITTATAHQMLPSSIFCLF